MSSPNSPVGPSRWQRYRTLVYVAVGLIALDVVIHANREVWQRYSPDDYAERLDGCRSASRDLIVVGGSPVSEGIDPEHLRGLPWRGRPIGSVYAMGLPGGTTSESWHAVLHGSRVPPRLLIYGTTASDLNDARHEPHGPHSLMTWGDWWSWATSRPESAEWVTRHFFQGRLAGAWQLFHHRDGIRLWAADRTDRLWPGAFPEVMGEVRENLAYSAAMREGNGYAPNVHFVTRRYDLFKAAGGREERFHFLEKYRLGSHLTYLHRMIDRADAEGTDLVIVDMPVTADLEEVLYPEAFAKYRAALRQVETTRAVRVLWANRAAVGLDDRHFSDLIHLNGEGAAILSRWIADQLRRKPAGG